MSKQSIANQFRTMAERIEAAEESEFGGAFVIVPPDGEQALIAMVTSNDGAADMFYLLLATQVQKERDRVDAKRPGGMGIRGR